MRSSRILLIAVAISGWMPLLDGQALVTLSSVASPSSGQAGITNINVTGSNFPTGTILPADITVALQPAAAGNQATTTAISVTTIIGSTRRVTFTIPPTITVPAPTAYYVSISGTSSNGTTFTSSNTALLTVNPGPSFTINPNTGQQGQTVSVTITGVFTNFVQGATQARFADRISVGGAAAGALGPVTVVNSTTATATLVIATDAALGDRTVTVQTGTQVATLANGFTVTPGTPVVTGVNPTSGKQGLQTTAVAIKGAFTHFVQGTTAASFGAGIVVVSTSVSDATHATAIITIAFAATPGPRDVTLRTGTETAVLPGGFTVTPLEGPTITDFTPKTGSSGTLITVTGTNLQPSAGTAAQVTLAKQNGGTISIGASTAAPTSLTFVIAAGAATGPFSVAVNGTSAHTTAALTINPSSSFSLSASPSSATLIQGQSIVYAVSLASTNGFTGLANLSVSGVPNGVTASFKPQRITAGQTSILALTAPAGQQTSTATLTATASATVDGLLMSQSATVSLSIMGPTTTLLGRTVVSDSLETSLAGVTITTLGKDGNGNNTGCIGHTVVSDAAGNFALTDLPMQCTGPQLIGFDGTTATAPPGKYAGVNLVFTITSGQVTVSPVLVHLPRIDTAETFLVTQNSTTDQSYAWKSIPGLSVTVYAGTTFTMPDGTQPNPFPLAGVSVPVDRLPDAKPPVPTMVMVFIVAFQPANAFTNQPVAVSYPNTVYNTPGTSSVLMTLDPTHGAMVPYGTGTVSNDATQFVPDPDPAHPGHLYGLVHFDWHMVGTPIGNQANPCDCSPCPWCGDPVDLSSGLAIIHETDISFGGARGTISVTRTYRNAINPAATTFGPFGYGTNHNWGYELDTVNPSSASVISLIMPDGNRFPFSKQGNGAFINSGVPILGGGVMTVNGKIVDLRWKDGTVFEFKVIMSGVFLRTLLDSVTDANGNRTQLLHNGFQIQAIIDPTERALTFNYDNAGCITQITAPDGTFVSYDYRGSCSLIAGTPLRQVTRTDGSIVQYSYDAANNLTSITDQNGAVFASLTYDSNKRVIQERLGDEGVLQFAYRLQNPLAGILSPVLDTTVTDPNGNQTTYRFNTNQGVIGVTDPLGRTRTLTRDGGNYVTAYQGNGSCNVCGDPAAGDQSFVYDDSTGNLLSYTDGAGSTTSFIYDPMFNKLTSITDPLGNLTTFTLDSYGNRLTQKDPNGNVTKYAYDQFGELISVTDPLNQTTSLTYDRFGNVTAIKDPLGNVTSLQYDINGRVTNTIDALGRRIAFTHDGANRITSQTDAQGRVTRFTYDELGDLTSVTDARNNKTSFTYDLLRRLLTRSDPLGRTDRRTYDLNGNLTQFVDRRGQTSTFSYDTVNRLIMETYPDATVTRTYDANDRLSQVNDSASGAFGFTYDTAGRLLSSATPIGSVQYLRDALGRVTSRQVIGQPAITYAYDKVGNLSSVAMPGMSANVTYDARNNIANISRLNGISSAFTYDPAARLLSISHARGTSVIDVEGYTYDAAGNRIGHGTSNGQALTTPAIPSALYDGDNEQQQFGSISNTFDPNGNLLTITGPGGTTTFTWDSRNRLQSMVSGGQTTSFTYDFAANLITQTDSGAALNLTKSFVLDDLTNVVYETASDGSSYSVLSGRSIDSHMGINPSDGHIQYGLTDGINSTMATVDQTGALKSQFVYEPFGQSSTASTYPFQFTGRMPVSGTLDYYRARFYNSQTGRFISEDLIGFAGGGPNLYAYVRGNPIGRIDPYGLWDVFGFGSITPATEGPVRVAGEGVALGGYDSNGGWYAGDIFAGGLEIGGQQNYVGGFVGTETTTLCPRPKMIALKEVSAGLEIPFLAGLGGGFGRYRTADERGFFFFVSGGVILQEGSLGFGFSTWTRR